MRDVLVFLRASLAILEGLLKATIRFSNQKLQPEKPEFLQNTTEESR